MSPSQPTDSSPRRRAPEARRRLAWGLCAATLAIAIPALGCGFGAEHAAEMQTLGAVCAGTPATGALPYTAGPGRHPVMTFQQRRDGGPWTQAFGMLTPATPGGHDIASTELVLCMGPEREVELERCFFDTQLRVGLVPVPGTRMEGPSFPRVRVERTVRVVAAATAETVGETTLSGDEPPPCGRSITGDPSDSDFRGGDVSDHAVNVWAEPFGLGTAH